MATWRELDMKDRTVIITGCNRGIGKESALQLAKRGAKVIMACRDLEKSEEVRQEIIKNSKNERVVLKKLDLNDLNAVKSFASEIISSENRLDVLICNAAAYYKEKSLTVDAVERGFSTNYLGHFVLVLQLLPLLKKAPNGRIAMVTSILYLYGHLDFENLNGEKSYNGKTMYCDHKLAILLFVKELSALIKECNVTINAVHPGVASTDLFNAVIGSRLTCIMPCLFDDMEDAASSAVFLATCADLGGISGKFFFKRKQASLAPHADNAAVAKMLWKVSCKYAGINPEQAL